MSSSYAGESLLPQEEMDRLSRIGRAIYNGKLKAILEPLLNGQDVAIHLDTGDYEVAPRRARPQFTLRNRHPQGGMILLMKVGPPRPDDLLTLRIAASRLLAESQK
jgi:hypothetical protein